MEALGHISFKWLAFLYTGLKNKNYWLFILKDNHFLFKELWGICFTVNNPSSTILFLEHRRLLQPSRLTRLAYIHVHIPYQFYIRKIWPEVFKTKNVPAKLCRRADKSKMCPCSQPTPLSMWRNIYLNYSRVNPSLAFWPHNAYNEFSIRI